jgi:hypothetical protein
MCDKPTWVMGVVQKMDLENGWTTLPWIQVASPKYPGNQ